MSKVPTHRRDPQRPDFEAPLVALEERMDAIEDALDEGVTAEEERGRLQSELAALREEHAATLAEIYSKLSAWQVVSKVSRHPRRPQSTDYIRTICSDFCQLHGDRHFGDDPAILTGFGRVGPLKVMLVAHRKGRDTEERILCRFGCANPEGYRKALKNMKLAEKFGVPIVTLVDTPGAYPGIGAEERGQAEAIAVNLREMSRLRVPILSVVIGEGGSGGALGIAVADRVAMLRYSWYSVISPEGCAAILWKQANPTTNAAAAEALHLTAEQNLKLGIIDEIIEEPAGGAHRDHAAAAETLKGWIVERVAEVSKTPIDELVERRYERFRRLGAYAEASGG